jgi:hypothetical protein
MAWQVSAVRLTAAGSGSFVENRNDGGSNLDRLGRCVFAECSLFAAMTEVA